MAVLIPLHKGRLLGFLINDMESLFHMFVRTLNVHEIRICCSVFLYKAYSCFSSQYLSNSHHYQNIGERSRLGIRDTHNGEASHCTEKAEEENQNDPGHITSPFKARCPYALLHISDCGRIEQASRKDIVQWQCKGFSSKMQYEIIPIFIISIMV